MEIYKSEVPLFIVVRLEGLAPFRYNAPLTMFDSNPLRTESNRAVSPVIGVILMVAITVILAAVIGAFVLEIGDQQETAPSTSFDTEQTTNFYQDDSDKINLTEVEITHAGGETLDISNNQIKVAGNESWWGVEEVDGGSNGNKDIAAMQPDITRAAGSNDQVELTSGQSWAIVAGNNNGAPSRENVDTTIAYNFDYSDADNNGDGHKDVILEEDGDSEDDNPSTGNTAIGSNSGLLSVLQQGDNVNVVWTASSGGKTQTLQRYTVQ
jgi:flagellin-like protein